MSGILNEVARKGAPQDLISAVRLWPTPSAQTGGQSIPLDATWVGRTTAYNKDGKKLQVGLRSAVQMWPTPTKSDGGGGPGRSPSRTGGDDLRTAVGGQLNPTWVEWLMGFPCGWTVLNDLGM